MWGPDGTSCQLKGRAIAGTQAGAKGQCVAKDKETCSPCQSLLQNLGIELKMLLEV